MSRLSAPNVFLENFYAPFPTLQGSRNTHLNEVTMDIVFIGAIALFATLIWGMTHGCAKLGERK
jgi:hypothetical protein